MCTFGIRFLHLAAWALLLPCFRRRRVLTYTDGAAEGQAALLFRVRRFGAGGSGRSRRRQYRAGRSSTGLIFRSGRRQSGRASLHRVQLSRAGGSFRRRQSTRAAGLPARDRSIRIRAGASGRADCVRGAVNPAETCGNGAGLAADGLVGVRWCICPDACRTRERGVSVQIWACGCFLRGRDGAEGVNPDKKKPPLAGRCRAGGTVP